MTKIRCLNRSDLEEIKEEFASIGADARGIEIMAAKAAGMLVKVEDVATPAANILKQQMLSLGGDAVTHRQVITHQIDTSDVILIGNQKILKELIPKIATQCFGLAEIAQQLAVIVEKVTSPPSHLLDCGGKRLDLSSRTHIMGILNITPDSFSDGGQYMEPQRALDRTLSMEREGADIIDLGGQSTRPGSEAISAEEELNRILPVLELLVNRVQVPISIDTYKSKVAMAALDAGAHMINDISGLRFDPQMADLVADYQVPVILMHIKGTPKDMQQNPTYVDLMGEISDYLENSAEIALKAGIEPEKIIVDPGIGFGKRVEDNFLILKRLKELKILGYPVLVGPSRKSFIGKTLNLPVNERLEGTAACVALAVANGADIIRVHDIKEMTRVARITDSIVGKTATAYANAIRQLSNPKPVKVC